MSGSYLGPAPVRALIAAQPQSVIAVYQGRAKNDVSARAVASDARAAGIEVVASKADVLDKLVPSGANHQGVVAIASAYVYWALGDILGSSQRQPLLLALDSVQDPYNVGAIIRSAYLLGVTGIVVPKDRSCGVTSVVTKTSAGATEYMKIAQVVNLVRAFEEMKQAGLWIAALARTQTSQPIGSLDADMPLCLVAGNEGAGIRALVHKHCDFTCHLPMMNEQIDSFNVSVATGIACYEVMRQRQHS